MSSILLGEKRAHTLQELIDASKWIAREFQGDQRAPTANEIRVDHSGKFGGDGINLKVIEETLSDGSKVLNIIATS